MEASWSSMLYHHFELLMGSCCLPLFSRVSSSCLTCLGQIQVRKLLASERIGRINTRMVYLEVLQFEVPILVNQELLKHLKGAILHRFHQGLHYLICSLETRKPLWIEVAHNLGSLPLPMKRMSRFRGGYQVIPHQPNQKAHERQLWLR